jgi:hypothetical protein
MKRRSLIITFNRKCVPFAPLLALVVMISFPLMLNHPALDEQSIQRRHMQVASAVAAAPWRIDHWYGEDVPVPKAGVEILRPNAILSRRFRDFNGGPPFTVMVIHCTDARDMEGHYPPVCFPANGWIEAAAPSQCTIKLNDAPMDLRVYQFFRPEAMEIDRSMRVFNCFILPDGQVATDMVAVEQAVKRYETSIQGVAQVLVVGPGDAEFEASVTAVGELLTGLSDLLAVLGRQQGDT